MIDYATFQRIQHLHRVEQLTVAQIALAMAMDARTVPTAGQAPSCVGARDCDSSC